MLQKYITVKVQTENEEQEKAFPGNGLYHPVRDRQLIF